MERNTHGHCSRQDAKSRRPKHSRNVNGIAQHIQRMYSSGRYESPGFQEIEAGVYVKESFPNQPKKGEGEKPTIKARKATTEFFATGNRVTIQFLDVKSNRAKIRGFCRLWPKVRMYETQETEKLRIEYLAWYVVHGLEEASFEALKKQDWIREIVSIRAPQPGNTSGASPMQGKKKGKGSKGRKRNTTSYVTSHNGPCFSIKAYQSDERYLKQ